MPQPTHVEDHEILYRSVRDQSDTAKEWTIVDGKLRFSQSAFNDRNRKPSIDRAILRVSVEDAKKSPTDGVTSLVASDIRAINKVKRAASGGRPAQDYAVDVAHDPLPGNVAHSEVRCAPALDHDTVFRKLKEALALLATARGWAALPASLKATEPPAALAQTNEQGESAAIVEVSDADTVKAAPPTPDVALEHRNERAVVRQSRAAPLLAATLLIAVMAGLLALTHC